MAESWWDKYGGTVTAVTGDVAQAYMGQRGANAQQEGIRQGMGAYEDAAQQAMGVQEQTLGGQQGALAPWIQAGLTALPQMQQMASQAPVGDFDVTQTPGYQFRMSEGMKALENSLSARGLSSSGAAMKGITRYGQNYASGEYGDEYQRRLQAQQQQYNQLAGLGNVGVGATGQQVNALGSYGANMGNTMMQAGQARAGGLTDIGGARASAYTGYGNALSDASRTLADQFTLNQTG
jgi:hypothetical protein